MEEKRNLLLTLRFKGTRYHGFQVQQNALSVAEVLQNALEDVTGTRDDIKGCSRTDAGVHANMYCVSLHTATRIPPRGLRMALNVRLPDDIAVVDVREVPQDFHARYSCIGKEYRYYIHNNPVRDPFRLETAYHCHRPLDLERMRQAAALLVGTHDFKAFSNAGGKEMADTTRTLSILSVEKEGDLVTITARADGFLYRMVRVLVGTLLHVSDGRLKPQDMPAILASCDRSRAGGTAPAHGLFLHEVFYPEEAFDFSIHPTGILIKENDHGANQ